MNDNIKSHYNKKGLYTGYDRSHKEREALDYYSTPTEEVINILNTLKLPLQGSVILEPCAGGGHMLLGIEEHLRKTGTAAHVIASDIQDRNNISSIPCQVGKEFDFIADEYPCVTGIDYVIMNPPYSIAEPFVMKALGIANKGILTLCRLQFLEGINRFNNIFSQCPPSDIYVYVDRIACFKNGNVQDKVSSAQAYAWFYWDMENEAMDTKIHWLRRNDKKSTED